MGQLLQRLFAPPQHASRPRFKIGQDACCDELKISCSGARISRVSGGYNGGRCYGQESIKPGLALIFSLRAPSHWCGSLRLGVTTRISSEKLRRPPQACSRDIWLLPVPTSCCCHSRQRGRTELSINIAGSDRKRRLFLCIRRCCCGSSRSQELPSSLLNASSLWPVLELLGQPAEIRVHHCCVLPRISSEIVSAGSVQQMPVLSLLYSVSCLIPVPAGARNYLADSLEAEAASDGPTCYALSADVLQPGQQLLLQVTQVPAVEQRDGLVSEPPDNVAVPTAALTFGVTSWTPVNFGNYDDWQPLPSNPADLASRPASEAWHFGIADSLPCRLLPDDELSLGVGADADGVFVQLGVYHCASSPNASAEAGARVRLPQAEPCRRRQDLHCFLVLPPGMAVHCLGCFEIETATATKTAVTQC